MQTVGNTTSLVNPLAHWLRKIGRAPVRVRNQIRAHLRPDYFDLHDLKTLNPFLAERGCLSLSADPYEAERGIEGAMRFVLGTLAGRPRLRRKYPQALSGGIEGPFAQSLLADPKLSANARDRIREAFDSVPSARISRVFEFREDLRGICPLGLTPRDRGDFLSWLITYGLADFGHSPEAAIWFHYELDEDPSRGIVATYRLLPEWQEAVPHGLTRFGWQELKNWIAHRYTIAARWLKRATLPPQYRPSEELMIFARNRPGLADEIPKDPERIVPWARSVPEIARSVDAHWYHGLGEDIRSGFAAQPAVNVIGLFRYTSGLQQAVKSTVESLNRVGVRTAKRDFPVLFLREPRNRERFDTTELHDITILNTGIDLPVTEAYRKSGLHSRPGVYRIGIWWWEMEVLPEKWHDRAESVDEVWAPTRFIADAMRKAFRKPVYTMNPGIELPAFEPLGKSYFQMGQEKFTFGFIFDMNSRMQRKNPLGLIEAFRRAFRPDEPVELVIKVSPPESYYKDQWQILHERITSTPNVKLMDRVLTRSELLAFVDAIDCYVSLHRSEGFGLTCAEAMLLGKPTIATAYSGNLDFMTNQNSYLVDYSLTRLLEDIDPYPMGAIWAEPSEDHAAALMRKVYDNRAEARRTGERARDDLTAKLSVRASGERMRLRLERIAQSRGR